MNSKVKARILKFMIANRGIPFTPSEIAAFCRLSKSRVSEILIEFEKEGIATAQGVGRSILYNLNTNKDEIKALIRLFKADCTKEYSILKEFVQRCRGLFGNNLLSVVLFGSRARATENQRSDFDLLVITKNLCPRDKIEELIFEITKKHSLNFDVIILSEDDFLDNMHSFSPLFVTMALGVKILFDRDFFIKHFKDFVKRLFEGRFIYYEHGQKWDIRKIGSRILQSL